MHDEEEPDYVDDGSELAVFLGAGASAAAGYRTFATFPDLLLNPTLRANEELRGLMASTRGFLEDIRTTLHLTRRAPTHDNFLWALDGYTRLWRELRTDHIMRSRFLSTTLDQSRFSHFSTQVQDAIDEITYTTISHYSHDRVADAQKDTSTPVFLWMRNVYRLYSELASHNSCALPVFTTNYDMFIEDLFAHFAATDDNAPTLIAGFSSKEDESKSWRQEQYERCHHSREDPQISFIRLHGCACWYYHVYGDPNIYYHRKTEIDDSLTKLCVMLPGRESKRGEGIHFFGFRRFAAVLKTCKILVFIGFSFRDHDVMHSVLLANAQRQSPLKLLVVDPALHRGAVVRAFEAAAKETHAPRRLLQLDDVHCIDCPFEPSVVQDKINALLGTKA
jgi:hypothetical protein